MMGKWQGIESNPGLSEPQTFDSVFYYIILLFLFLIIKEKHLQAIRTLKIISYFIILFQKNKNKTEENPSQYCWAAIRPFKPEKAENGIYVSHGKIGKSRMSTWIGEKMEVDGKFQLKIQDREKDRKQKVQNESKEQKL